MNIEKDFVPYEESFELKELGFDEPCFGVYFKETKQIVQQLYNDTRPFDKEYFIPIPLYQQAFRWFREKYGLFIQPNRTIDSQGVWYYFSISTKRTDVCEGSFVYEEAELACLRKLIQIVKEQKS